MDYSINVYQVKTGKVLAIFPVKDETAARNFYSEIVQAQWHVDVTVKLFNSTLNEQLSDTVILDNIHYSPAHE